MEIKILCHCGTKFKFDAEPVGGRMPMAVSCPGCGVDTTEHANAFIQQSVAAVISTAATQAPSAAPAAHAPPPPPPQPKLRISGAAPAPPAVAAAEPAAAELPPTPPPMRPFPQAATAAKPKAPGNFGLGMLGGLLGTIVGVALWLTIDSFYDMKVKFLMLAVGFCAGMGARLLGRDEGSQQLGLITATLVLVGIFGAQYWLAYQELFGHDFDLRESVAEQYKEELAEAKTALAAIPNESDDEIRQFLFKEWEQDMKEEDEEMTEKITLSSISTNDIAEFRQERLPRMKDLVEGKITVADFQKEIDTLQKEIDTNVEKAKESSGIKLYLIVQGLNPLKLGILIAALGLAYKMTANA